jgi:hypothetical protein
LHAPKETQIDRAKNKKETVSIQIKITVDLGQLAVSGGSNP